MNSKFDCIGDNFVVFFTPSRSFSFVDFELSSEAKGILLSPKIPTQRGMAHMLQAQIVRYFSYYQKMEKGKKIEYTCSIIFINNIHQELRIFHIVICYSA